MKIVFFGTSSFAARVLSFLVAHKIVPLAIVTRVDKPKGRNLELSFPPVKQTAIELCSHIPLFQPVKASTPEFAAALQQFHPDLFVVVAYGEIIKQNLLDIPKKGCINIHASLLPKYRGAAPIQRSLMDGVQETGITIIEMTPQMDAGDILAMESILVPSEMTFGELEPLLCDLGGRLVLKVIQQIEKGTQTKLPQDHSLATLAPKMSAQEEVIDWSQSAQDLHNLVRALSPFPGAWCHVRLGSQDKRLKIKRSRVERGVQGVPGTLLSLSKEDFIIACGTDALRLVDVQLEGKKTMSAADFMKGIHQPLQIVV